MRLAWCLVSVLVACSSPDRRPSAPSAGGSSGPDAILIRIPRVGGTARAYRWGSDSAFWSSSARVPPLSRVLAFDDAQGSLAYVDTRGVPGRLNLRVGSAGAAAPTALTSLASADGWAIYGLTPRREVRRHTPSGTWSFGAGTGTRALIPAPDGSLLLVGEIGGRLRLRRVRPPEPRVSDTGSVPAAKLIVTTDLGDRVYFIGDSGVVGVRARDLVRTRAIRLPGPAADAVATPSGDRIFVALSDQNEVLVIDRYAEEIDRRIELPGGATALRMDPDGRYLLARALGIDSVRIVSIGTSRVIGTVPSAWHDDLPFVAPDGRVALLQGRDVVIVDAETRRARARFRGGADDVWTLIRWNGFRPRAAGLDAPVLFAADSADPEAAQRAVDSTVAANAVVPPGGAMPVRGREPPARPADPRADPAAREPRRAVYTLSFAALLSEERARQMAASITVDGRPARVVPSVRDGTPVFRIVFGPFDSREEAERAGRRSGLPFWVYEGAP